MSASRHLMASGSWLLLLDGLVTLLGGVIPPLTALSVSLFLERLVSAGTASTALLLLACCLTAGSLVPLLAQLVHDEVSRRVRARMQLEFFRVVDSVPGIARFEQPGFRDHLRLAQQGCETAPATLLRSSSGLLQSALAAGGFAAGVAHSSYLLALAMFAISLWQLRTFLEASSERHAMFWRTSPHERRRDFYASLLTSVQALKEIRLFGLGTMFMTRMSSELRAANRLASCQAVRDTKRGALASLPPVFVAVTGLIWVSMTHALDVQQASLLIASLMGFTSALALVHDRLADVRAAVRQYGDFESLVGDLRVPTAQARAAAKMPERPFTLEFQDVWFRYDEQLPWVLRGVNLVVRRGEPVGLVGQNGAGKSTVLKLIARLYEPTKGRILLDGVDIADLEHAEYRSVIGAAFQDFMAYDLTLYENISIGLLEGGSPDAVEEAAALTGVADLAASLPEGFETRLTATFDTVDPDDGQRPMSLSGGQWQRVALARAMMRRRHPILFLDEPTAGLDAEAEAALRRVILESSGDSILIVISHRMSTIRRCPNIAVLEGGRITCSGTHNDLMQRGGLYRDLFQTQSDGYGESFAEHQSLASASALGSSR